VDASSTETIRKIIKADINPLSFTAYQICNGRAEAIFDRESGLIKENYIDASSDRITEDFESLMNLAK